MKGKYGCCSNGYVEWLYQEKKIIYINHIMDKIGILVNFLKNSSVAKHCKIFLNFFYMS